MTDTAAGDLPPLDLTYARLLLATATDTAASWTDASYRMRKTAYEIRREADNPGNRWSAEFKAGMQWASTILSTRADEPDEYWRRGNV